MTHPFFSRNPISDSLTDRQNTFDSITGSNVPSPTSTVFYSAESEHEPNTSYESKRRLDTNDIEENGRAPEAKKTQSRYNRRYTVIDDSKVINPDFTVNSDAWAFLQSFSHDHDSIYLNRRSSQKDGRTGYLLGRASNCDIQFEQSEISKKHCLIYMVMETGSNGKAKGIRIFLEDLSFNGTYVNNVKILAEGKSRVLLKHGDIIQLFKCNQNTSKFRVLFPRSFEAKTCESEYELTKELGRGNFAAVYHARHNVSKDEVAIKVLSKLRVEKKPKLIEAFVSEVVSMMILPKHPLIVHINRVFNEEKRIYLVLEYVSGGELFNLIVEKKKLSEDEARFVFWQLFRAIKFLHDNDIAHRDIKPENVLISDVHNLHLKVTDFGLSKLESRKQAFDSQCGTPNYVAPEVLDPSETRAYSKSCDLWSLGVMLYICLCGYPPFSEEQGPPNMKTQIKMAMYSFENSIWDDISAEAKDLISCLLKPNPDERATIHEVIGHEWMQKSPDDLQKRCATFGEDLGKIEILSRTEDLSVTQMAASQSQHFF